MLDNASPFLAPLPPQAGSRNEVAARRLRQALVGCEIAPGEAFTEAGVAERFRLGRAAVRVALTSLAAAGFARREPRQGWRAAPVTGALVGDVIAARRRLEPALAERRLDEADLRRLSSLAQVASAAIAAGDRKALSTARVADRQILDDLSRGAGGLTARWLGEAWDHGARIVHLLDGRAPLWPGDRGPLLKALSAGDAEAAKGEIERDIAGFETACIRAMLSSGLGADPLEKTGGRSARRKPPAAPPVAVANRNIER